MNPPEMAGWNLALRFALEIGALIGLGVAAWQSTSGPVRWIAAIAVPLVAAAVWGTFNVLNDPSRSGEAPVEVAGWLRLLIELTILGGGAVAIGIVGGPIAGIGFAVLILVHYVASWSRIQWLIST
jgi:Protein of unknown function (DUF2568)